MNNKNMKNQKGISLIEVLITIIIIAVGILGLAKLQQRLWHHSGLLEQQNQAIIIAEKKIEELRGFEQVQSAAGKFAYDDIATESPQTINSTNTNYTLVSNVDASDPNYKIINVTVSWTDTNGSAQSINLTSIISKIDPGLTGTVFHH